jgi:chromosome segregation ATPase
MFSGIGGTELAARVSEWLDTHPEILKAFTEQPDMVAIVERYATELRPFVERYTANHPTQAAESAKGSELAAETAGKELAQAKDREAALTVERDALAVEIAELRTARDKAAEAMTGLTAERDELAGKLTKANADLTAVTAERDAALAKLAAIEAGAPPVSSVPAENKETGSMWDDARKTKHRK